MAAITGTKSYCTSFSGNKKMVVLTATIGSGSDTITVDAATHGIAAVDGIVDAHLTAGMDAACLFLQASFSGAVITVKSFGEDGAAASDFTGTTISVTVIGH